MDPNMNMASAKRKLIVNYLPQTMVERTLLGMFAPFGVVQSVHIVKDKTTNYSFGYGFVTYEEEESGNNAINHLNGLEISGKRLKVAWSRDAAEKNTNLYVTNLPRNITVFDLDEIFGPYGNIVQRAVLVDKVTQMPRGVAFVRYSKDVEATAAMEDLNGKPLRGCEEPIQIKIAEDHSKKKAAYYTGLMQGQQMGRGPVGRGRGRGGGGGRGRADVGGFGPINNFRTFLPQYSRFNRNF